MFEDADDGKIIAALIGAGTAVIGILIKDVIIKYIAYILRKRRTANKIFKQYRDPLLHAADSLLWRLDEILNKVGRGTYLQDEEQHTPYSQYKRTSTVYRICVLLGWIRAYNRELTSISELNQKAIYDINNTIRNIQKAFADGAHVEILKVKAILKLWSASFNEDYPNVDEVAAKVDFRIKKHVRNGNKNIAKELNTDNQLKLIKDIADLLSKEFKCSNLSDELIQETQQRAIEHLSLKEAYLYRDWQSAIGDMMLIEINGDQRKYNVLDFYQFESKYFYEKDYINVWYNRVDKIIANLDPSKDDKSDLRIAQLQKITQAVSDLVILLLSKDKELKKNYLDSYNLALQITDKSSSGAGVSLVPGHP
ncbi:MAG: hypothetical protein WBB45_09540 [Cyclobacteriaceae bacterium]